MVISVFKNTCITISVFVQVRLNSMYPESTSHYNSKYLINVNSITLLLKLFSSKNYYDHNLKCPNSKNDTHFLLISSYESSQISLELRYIFNIRNMKHLRKIFSD